MSDIQGSQTQNLPADHITIKKYVHNRTFVYLPIIGGLDKVNDFLG
jgi:hypothetical protein